MTVHLTLFSSNDLVLHLVSDYARGFGCGVDPAPSAEGQGIRVEVPDVGHGLVELLTHVALSATKAGVDVAEPLCRVTYHHSGVAAAVTLGFRVAEFRIDKAAATGV
jgi:hypothetical protein